MVFPRLLMLFILVPLAELYVLIKLGKYLGTGNTIIIVILTGIMGAAFARSQGAGIILKIRNSLQQGMIPGEEMIQGLLILAGGLMLITPGFITDLLGFLLILPYSRKWAARWLMATLDKKIRTGQWSKTRFRVDLNGDKTDDDPPDHPEIMQ